MRGQSSRRRRALYPAVICQIAGTLIAAGAPSAAQDKPPGAAGASPAACGPGAAGITLPPGFCATVFADHIGHARHMVVAPNGVLYVNTWSGSYYRSDAGQPGGFLVALRDTDRDGQADASARFGPTDQQGGHGGTGIAI
jgi:glucose/arabinose dehydrogenase